MENLNAFSGLINVCSNSSDRAALLAAFPVHASMLLHFEHCFLKEINAENLPETTLMGGQQSISPMEHELADEVIRTAQPRVTAGSDTLPAVICVPLLAGDRSLGALGFKSGKPGVYQAEEIATAELLAGLLAQALDRLRLIEALDKATHEVDHLGSFPDLNPAAILEMDENGVLFYANPSARRMFPNLEEECSRAPMLADLPVMLVKLRATREREFVREIKNGDAWYQQMLHLVPKTGRLRSFIIDITSQKRAAEKALSQNQYLEALHETTLGLIRRLDLDELLQVIITRAGLLLNTPHSFIFLLEPGENEIEQRVGTGLFASTVGFRLKRGDGISGQVWETGQPLLVEDYSTWRFRSEAFQNLKGDHCCSSSVKIW